MGGIAGVVRFDGARVDEDSVRRMCEVMTHRGAPVFHRSEGVVLAQLGGRVRASEDGAPVVGDVRLDARTDLVERLRLDPEDSDVALMVAATQRWGESCGAHLVGDFAFAMWDARERRLICLRDHMGVRPFVYARRGPAFVFASEAKALFASGLVQPLPDEVSIALAFSDDLDDRERTFYRDVRRLPPGTTLRVTAERTEQARYWHLEEVPELRLRGDRAYEEAFRETFVEAVRCRMGPEGVGTELSGGLDSSSVTAVAASLGSGELDVFTAAFSDGLSDESAYRDALAARYALVRHELTIEEVAVAGAVRRVVEEQGEPWGGPMIVVESALYRLAARRGVHMLLDGFDGDTTVSHGVGRLSELARRFHLGTMAKEARALARRRGTSTIRTLASEVVLPLLPAPGRAWVERLRGRARIETPILAPGLIRSAAEAASPRPPMATTVRAEHIMDLNSGLTSIALEIRERAAAAAGIELRHPFFDRRLVELCVSLPADQRLRHGWTRWILRRALDPFLPGLVSRRPGKAALSPELVRGLVDAEAEAIAAFVRTGGGAAGTFLDPGVLRDASSRSFDRLDTALELWQGWATSLWLAGGELRLGAVDG